MLGIIGAILLFCWIIGLSFHVMGSFIHLLFVVAIAMFLIHFIRGRAAY
jgi:hypothetical protein